MASSLELSSKILKKIKPKKAHQISKFSELTKLKWPHNYWYLASNIGENSKNKLLKNTFKSQYLFNDLSNDLNSFLLLDQLFVLPNDMLKKVDLMSMQHSLEVRTPFMDKDLPTQWKLNKYNGKFILKETFKNILPEEIFTRKKQGFEVPLNAWIKKNWNELIPSIWFDEKYIFEQQIFNFSSVLILKSNLRIINRFNIGGPTYNATFLTRFMSDEFETLLIGGLPEESESDSLHIPNEYGVEPTIIKELQREPNLKSDRAAYLKIKQIIKEFKPQSSKIIFSDKASFFEISAFVKPSYISWSCFSFLFWNFKNDDL